MPRRLTLSALLFLAACSSPERRETPAASPEKPGGLAELREIVRPFYFWSLEGPRLSYGQDCCEGFVRSLTPEERARFEARASKRILIEPPSAPMPALDQSLFKNFIIDLTETVPSSTLKALPVMPAPNAQRHSAGIYDFEAPRLRILFGYGPLGAMVGARLETEPGSDDFWGAHASSKDGHLTFWVMESANRLLQLDQSPDGSIALRDERGAEKTELEAPSFLDLYFDHREYMEREVLPTFEFVGFARLPRPFAPEVVAEVLALLREAEPSPETQERGAAILARLQSADPQARDRLLQELSEEYAARSPEIAAARRAAGAGSEARLRLDFLIERRGPEVFPLRAFAAKSGLPSRPAYLEAILPGLERDEAALVRAALNKRPAEK